MSDEHDKTQIPLRPVKSDTPAIDPALNLEATRLAPNKSTRSLPSNDEQKPIKDTTAFKPRLKVPDPSYLNTPSAPSTDATQFATAMQPRPQKMAADDVTQMHLSRSNPLQSEIPRLKNRFLLEQVLGSGGMGVVYKAKDLLKVEAQDRDPYVAIKVLGEEFKSHPEAFIALQRESRKTQRIAHPNIVNVHDFDKDGDTVFMTMEYLEGTPLDKLIKKYRDTGLPKDSLWDILKGICDALAYAHRQQIIHSDLKPGNIFITLQNTAKVFDFGIARAVAKAEHETSVDDRTVFDAGNLGALTPAYASLEMLNGETPDVRDDIYALGCIAYELFAGHHPFSRKNAKEAQAAGLKPDRIENIPKSQWKVIEKALAFKREDRIATVQEFWDLISQKKRSSVLLITSVVLMLTLMAGGFWWIQRTPPAAPQLTADDFRSEIEAEIYLKMVKEKLTDLLDHPTLDATWEESLWQEFTNLQKFLKPNDVAIIDIKTKAFALYLQHIQKRLVDKDIDQLELLIEHAGRYSSQKETLEALLKQLADVKATLARDKQEQLAREQAEREKQAAAQLKIDQQKNEQQAQIAEQLKQTQKTEQVTTAYQTAMNTVQEQLQCSRHPNMADFGIAIDKLRSLNAAQYKIEEAGIITALSACLQKIGGNFPDRADKIKIAALAIFPNHPKLLELHFEVRDPCNASLAGMGAKNSQTVCQDNLKVGQRAPTTVVIPAKGALNIFALGKYEVTVNEFNHFCRASGLCKSKAQNPQMPITDIDISSARAYLKWISEQTGQTYRLPTLLEWQTAAGAPGQKSDTNINCIFAGRGIEKGGTLLSAQVGQQNSWGVINHLGNVQEWVDAGGGQLMAVGGSYRTPMKECSADFKQTSQGLPDAQTGFRVVREINAAAL